MTVEGRQVATVMNVSSSIRRMTPNCKKKWFVFFSPLRSASHIASFVASSRTASAICIPVWLCMEANASTKRLCPSWGAAVQWSMRSTVLKARNSPMLQFSTSFWIPETGNVFNFIYINMFKWIQLNAHIKAWLYFYACKYTFIYWNTQIRLNIFIAKNKKIRK